MSVIHLVVETEVVRRLRRTSRSPCRKQAFVRQRRAARRRSSAQVVRSHRSYFRAHVISRSSLRPAHAAGEGRARRRRGWQRSLREHRAGCRCPLRCCCAVRHETELRQCQRVVRVLDVLVEVVTRPATQLIPPSASRPAAAAPRTTRGRSSVMRTSRTWNGSPEMPMRILEYRSPRVPGDVLRASTGRVISQRRDVHDRAVCSRRLYRSAPCSVVQKSSSLLRPVGARRLLRAPPPVAKLAKPIGLSAVSV